MFVYTLYTLSMSVCCVCLCFSDEPVLFCIYVWKNVVFVNMFIVGMAPGKISYKLTGTPSLNKVFELNWIESIWRKNNNI